MRRHETPRAAAIRIRRPIGFREQLLGIVLLSLALLMYVSSDTYLRQLPAGIWPALLMVALVALRRPAAIVPIPSLKVVEPDMTPRSLARIKVATLPADEVAMPSETARERQWRDVVGAIGTQHPCKFGFVLGALVFGPQAEVMPIIDACFPPDTKSAVTRRVREIILIGRAQYAAMNADCSQKTFIDSVIKENEAMLAASQRPKPGIGYDVYRYTLTGRSSSVARRLRVPLPVD